MRGACQHRASHTPAPTCCIVVQVRLAAPSDAPALHDLMLAAFDSFRPLYTPGCFDATVLDATRIRKRMAEGPVWVAETEDGAFVGTLAVVEDARGVYLRGMAVHPDARRGGIGRRLLEAAEAFGRDCGAACLWLSTTPFLLGSIALYERFGFVHGAKGPPELFGTPLLSMQKRLA